MADYFASVLRMSRQQIVTDIHILELGVDSIMLVEAQRWIKVRFGCLVEVPQFFEELNTIDRLAAFLADKKAEIAAEPDDRILAKQESASSVRAAAIPAPETADMQNTRYTLLRSQLSLLHEVIEAQNRLLTTLHNTGTKPHDAKI